MEKSMSIITEPLMKSTDDVAPLQQQQIPLSTRNGNLVATLQQSAVPPSTRNSIRQTTVPASTRSLQSTRIVTASQVTAPQVQLHTAPGATTTSLADEATKILSQSVAAAAAAATLVGTDSVSKLNPTAAAAEPITTATAAVVAAVPATPKVPLPTPFEKKKFAPTRDIDVIKKQDVFRDEGVRSLLMMMVHLCDLYVAQVNAKTKQQVELLHKKYGRNIDIDVLEIRKDCLSNAQYWSAEIKKQNEIEAKEHWPMIGKFYEYSLGLLVQATKLVDPCLTDFDDSVAFNDADSSSSKGKPFTFSAPPFNEFLHTFYRNCSTDSSVIYGNIEMLSEDQKALVCKYILRKTLQHCCNLVSRSEVFSHIRPSSSQSINSDLKFQKGSHESDENDPKRRFIIPPPVVTSIHQPSSFMSYRPFYPVAQQHQSVVPVQSGAQQSLQSQSQSQTKSHSNSNSEQFLQPGQQPVAPAPPQPQFAPPSKVPMTARSSTMAPRYSGPPLTISSTRNNLPTPKPTNTTTPVVPSQPPPFKPPTPAAAGMRTPLNDSKTVNVRKSPSRSERPERDQNQGDRQPNTNRNERVDPKERDHRSDRNEHEHRNDRNEHEHRNDRNEHEHRNDRDNRRGHYNQGNYERSNYRDERDRYHRDYDERRDYSRQRGRYEDDSPRYNNRD